MIIVGILLVSGAGTLSGLLIAGNLSAGPVFAPTLVGHVLPAFDPVAIFCAGLGCGFLVLLGAQLMASAVGRWRARQYDDPVDTFLPGLWRAP